MDMKNYIGEEVINKNNEIGKIIDVDDYIHVEFSDRESRFTLSSFEKGFLKFSNEDIQNEIETSILDKKEKIKEKVEKISKKRIKVVKVKKVQPVKTKAKKVKSIDEKFGADYHSTFLSRSPILTYEQVEKQFNISIRKYGKGINKTDDAIVLISVIDEKKDNFIYHDHWTEDGDYIYSGEGKKGNQTYSRGNKNLIEGAKEGLPIYLFVKFSSKEYYYQGEFELVEYKTEIDKDDNGNDRDEYKFRLRRK